MGKKAVAYFRVSTKKQGASGLGLDAQRAAVATYAGAHGLDVTRTFTEIESGRHDDRAELEKALAFARRSGAVLLIAKLDRLSRSVAFIAEKMERGLCFVVVDMPSANEMTIHIMSAVAQEEARAISARTKVALAAAKARGQLLGAHRPGHPSMTSEARAKGRELAARSISAKARAAYADLSPEIATMRAEGMTFGAIANRLNAEGQTTRTGTAWHPAQVKRVIERAA